MVGAVFSIATLSLTLPYFLSQYSVWADHLDQVIGVETEKNAVIDARLNLQVGSPSNEEGYEFRVAFLLIDQTNYTFPTDFYRIGTV